MDNKLTKPFLLLLVVLVLAACYIIFQPFLIELLIAAVLATILYRPYSKLVHFLRGRRSLAAVIMCLLVIILIIFPLTQVMIMAGKKSVTAYNSTVYFLEQNNEMIQDTFLHRLGFTGFDNSNIQNFVLDIAKKSSEWMIQAATIVVKGTTNFFVSLFLIVFTMFFFFMDGRRMLKKLMLWSPLPNKYDLQIFEKFRSVSYSTIVSTFVTAIAQGVIGGIGYMIIGLPAFFAGILVAFTSLLPYIGSMLIYVPTGIYLLLTGQIWQGIFILLWGALVIGNSDNLIRTYMIKGKAKVNPVFVFFSIFGGVILFGFWGVVIGPLIISIAVTVFHIYELEYDLKDEEAEADRMLGVNGNRKSEEKKKKSKKEKEK